MKRGVTMITTKQLRSSAKLQVSVFSFKHQCMATVLRHYTCRFVQHRDDSADGGGTTALLCDFSWYFRGHFIQKKFMCVCSQNGRE